jgi:hypothetical protein
MTTDDGRGHEGHLSRDYWRITPYDSARCRALWMRSTHILRGNGEPPIAATPSIGPSEIELRAGREGDDEQITLRAGQTLTPKDVYRLTELLTRARYDAGIPASEHEREGEP